MGDHRPYVDTPVTDVDAATDAAAVAAERFGLARPVVMRISMNAVYEVGDVVLRVAHPSVPAERSLELAEFLLAAGIRVPRPRRDDVVRHGAFSVTAWERLRPVDGAVSWPEVGSMVRTLHGLDIAAVGEGIPLPPPASFPWWRFDDLLADVAADLDEASATGLHQMVDRHRGWEDLDRGHEVVCHGDVHPGNVVQTSDGPALLDWDLLCRAPRWWDHTPLMRWAERWGGQVGTYEDFADGYGRSFRSHPGAEAVAELRLVAATIMAVRRRRARPDDVESAAEADRRLATWRDDGAAPSWRAR